MSPDDHRRYSEVTSMYLTVATPVRGHGEATRMYHKLCIYENGLTSSVDA